MIQYALTHSAGVTFTGEGKAVITYAFTETAPSGKIARVFYIDGDNKFDMNATFEGVKLPLKRHTFQLTL